MVAAKILLPIDRTGDRSWKQALPVAVEQAIFSGAELHAVGVIPEIRKLAQREGFDLIVMASTKGDVPNCEMGPNLARVARNAPSWSFAAICVD
ncbi:MAG: hypothetical protein AAF625_13075 [Pseudomonadota bacterium]